MRDKVQFSIHTEETHTHNYTVRMEFYAESDATDLILPSWTPGSYMIRDYSRHLHGFQSKQKWEQIDLSIWRIHSNPGERVEVEYKVYAFEDLSVRTNYLDEDFAFIHPAALFLYPQGREESQFEICFSENNPFPYIHGSLEKSKENNWIARGLDELYDSPFFLCYWDAIRFQVDATKHSLVIQGNISQEWKATLMIDLQKIIQKEVEIMGGENPNSFYLMVLILTDGGYGGLEHANSSINIFDIRKAEDEKEYKKLLELLAHEYFHLWNVKRIRPISLGPFDYERPNLTKELWIAEGITSFYDAYFLLKTGHLNPEQYLEKLSDDISILEENMGEEVMSLEESSLTAWNKLYKRTADSHNTSISYYTKGAILTLCMNLRILKESKGKKDFSSVMRELYQVYYLEKNRGFTKEEFFEIVHSVTGLDLFAEFDPFIIYPRRIPVYEYLDYLGIERIYENEIADPGFQCRESPGSITINKIFRKRISPFSFVYLGDEILGVNGKRITNLSDWKNLLGKAKPEETWELQISRKSELQTEEIILVSHFEKKQLVFQESPSPEVEELRKSFFE